MNTLLHQKPHNPNINKNEYYALKHLRDDKTIIIKRADEGNTTVIMNKTEYEKKAKEHLHPYEQIKEAKSKKNS